MIESPANTAQARAARETLAAAEGAAVAAEARNLEAFDANAEARAELRQQADKQQLRLAMRDLTEGVRGVIRVAPLTALVVGLAAGMLLRRNRRRPPPPRR
jgi:hypothetical protein